MSLYLNLLNPNPYQQEMSKKILKIKENVKKFNIFIINIIFYLKYSRAVRISNQPSDGCSKPQSTIALRSSGFKRKSLNPEL